MSSPFDQLFVNMGNVPLQDRPLDGGFTKALAEALDKLQVDEVLAVKKPENWSESRRFLPLFNAAKTLQNDKKFQQRLQPDGSLFIKRIQ